MYRINRDINQCIEQKLHKQAIESRRMSLDPKRKMYADGEVVQNLLSPRLSRLAQDFSQTVEYFTPGYHDEERRVTFNGAIFSLISCMVGGGVLSLPYAFRKCGLVPGMLLLIFFGAMSDLSLILLIKCSRRTTNIRSYEDVVEKAFGSGSGLIMAWMLFVLLFLVVVAYTILLGDLIAPVVEICLGKALGGLGRRMCMVAVIVCIFPFTLAKSLHALRFISVVSVCSVATLSVIISVRAFQRHLDPASFISTADAPIGQSISPLFQHVTDLVSATPLLIIAYLCHFNALPLHCEMEKPDEARVRCMIHTVVAGAILLFSSIGVSGYLYARELTDGNILNNFPADDYAITAGRVCLSFVCMCSTPIMVLPCRNALHTILKESGCIPEYKQRVSPKKANNNNNRSYGTLTLPTLDPEQSTHLSPNSQLRRIALSLEQMQSPLVIHTIPDLDMPWLGNFETVFIVFGSLLVALSIKSVATVWSLLGSTIGIMISYVLPGAMYLKVSTKEHDCLQRSAAWFLLLFGLASLPWHNYMLTKYHSIQEYYYCY
eukprot:g36352.t1